MTEIQNLNRKQTGAMGEQVACDYLHNQGYHIVACNEKNKIGEIDIIAQHAQRGLVFVEVKTVEHSVDNASRSHRFDPLEKLDSRKIRQVSRTIVQYLSENNQQDVDWALDGVVVFLDTHKNQARVQHLEHISRDW